MIILIFNFFINKKFNQLLSRNSYYQSIVSFAKDDYVEFRINLFSEIGTLNLESLTFEEIEVCNTPIHSFLNYEKSLVKSEIKQDVSRSCELENLIHVWKSEKYLTNKKTILEFKNLFEPNFSILEIVYDFSKVFIFKFKMKAKIPGIYIIVISRNHNQK